jgi:hypothetical protein
LCLISASADTGTAGTSAGIGGAKNSGDVETGGFKRKGKGVSCPLPFFTTKT